MGHSHYSLIDIMLLILDDNSKHIAYVENMYFLKEKIGFVTALDLNKCLKPIRKPGLPQTCAPICTIPLLICE